MHKALDGQIPGLPGDDCRRPTPQKHRAELSQEASWVGQRLEREELSVGGVDRETKESHKAICSLCCTSDLLSYTLIQVLGDRVKMIPDRTSKC